MGVSSQKDHLVLYRSWVMQLRNIMVLVQEKIERKMTSTNTSSGNGVEDSGSSANVMQMIDKSSKQVVKEIQDQITVVLSHLDGLRKDMELLQKAMETMNIGMINLKFKLDNIEVKFEMTMVGVLKEVFGLHNAPVPMAKGVKEAANNNQETDVEEIVKLS